MNSLHTTMARALAGLLLMAALGLFVTQSHAVSQLSDITGPGSYTWSPPDAEGGEPPQYLGYQIVSGGYFNNQTVNTSGVTISTGKAIKTNPANSWWLTVNARDATSTSGGAPTTFNFNHNFTSDNLAMHGENATAAYSGTSTVMNIGAGATVNLYSILLKAGNGVGASTFGGNVILTIDGTLKTNAGYLSNNYYPEAIMVNGGTGANGGTGTNGGAVNIIVNSGGKIDAGGTNRMDAGIIKGSGSGLSTLTINAGGSVKAYAISGITSTTAVGGTSANPVLDIYSTVSRLTLGTSGGTASYARIGQTLAGTSTIWQNSTVETPEINISTGETLHLYGKAVVNQIQLLADSASATLHASASLEKLSGTNPFVIYGTGKVTVAGAHTIASNLSSSGPTYIGSGAGASLTVTGDLTSSGPVALVLGDGTTPVTMTVNGTATLYYGSTSRANSTINPLATFVAKGTTYIGGSSGSNLTIKGTYDASGQTILNSSPINVQGGTLLAGTLDIRGSIADITINGGGTVVVTDNISPFNYSAIRVGTAADSQGSLSMNKSILSTGGLKTTTNYIVIGGNGAYGTVTLTGWAAALSVDTNGLLSSGENLSTYGYNLATQKFAAIQYGTLDLTTFVGNNIILQGVAFAGASTDLTGQVRAAGNVQMTILQDGTNSYAKIHPGVDITAPSILIGAGGNDTLLVDGGTLHLNGKAVKDGTVPIATTLTAFTGQNSSTLAVTEGASLTTDTLSVTSSTVDVGTVSSTSASALTVSNGLTLSAATLRVGSSESVGTLTARGANTTLGSGSSLAVASGSTYDASSRSVAVNTGGSLNAGAMTVSTGTRSTETGVYAQALTVAGGSATLGSLDVQSGVVSVSAGTLTVSGGAGSLQSAAAGNASTTGINVSGTGVLTAGYSAVVNAAGDDLISGLNTISLGAGSVLNLTGYAGTAMNLTDFTTLTGKLLSVGSQGSVQGITIAVDTTNTLQELADAKAAAPEGVVQAGTLTSGTAVVAGVRGATTTDLSGGAALTLTGQGATANGELTEAGVTLNGGTLTLGNPAGGSTGGTLQGGIASSGTDTVNVVNGAFTVDGGITGNSNTTVNVGGASGAGTLLADGIAMNGGRIDFDPPFVAAGDTSNASLGGLTFASASVDALMNVGRNSMVSLGSTDAEWLRTEVQRYQSDGKGLWGQDITAALAIRAPQTLAAIGGINVDGTWVFGGAAAATNTATFADKSLLVVDAPGVGSGVALSGSGTGSTLAVDAGARLHIVGGQGGDTINVTGGFGSASNGTTGWIEDNLTTSTGLLTATGNAFSTTDGSYSVTLSANKAKPVFPLLSDAMANMIDTTFAQTRLDVNAANAGVRFLSRATSDNYIGRSDTRLAAATIEGAAQMASVGAVQGVTLSAQNAGANALAARTRLANPAADTKGASVTLSDGSVSASRGVSGGSAMKNGLGLWVMPLWQSDSVSGMKAENFKTGYTSNLGGIALGADYTIENAWRFGVAINAGGGYATSKGDFNRTTNTFDFWGIMAYGGWSQNKFAITADVGYTSTNSELRQNTPASMNFGSLKGDVRAHLVSTGLRGEYRFETAAVDITPHIGIRYTWLNTQEFDVKGGGGTVFKVASDNQSLVTFPVGVTFSKDIVTDSGWTFRPLLDLGVIPAAGDVKARNRVRIPGMNASANLKTQVVDTLTFDGTAGFELKNDNLAFGLNYNLQASEHRTGHGVFATFRYEF